MGEEKEVDDNGLCNGQERGTDGLFKNQRAVQRVLQAYVHAHSADYTQGMNRWVEILLETLGVDREADVYR